MVTSAECEQATPFIAAAILGSAKGSAKERNREKRGKKKTSPPGLAPPVVKPIDVSCLIKPKFIII